MAPSTRSSSVSTTRDKPSKESPDMDDQGQLSDAAMRKKKNADAQAAFRARRANYIATLEETVTNLESVVYHLQESVRSAESEATHLRQENEQLKLAGHNRDAFWRSLWQSRTGTEPPEGIPPLSHLFNMSSRPPSPVVSHLRQQNVHVLPPYSEENHLSYPPDPSESVTSPSFVITSVEHEYPARPGSTSYAQSVDRENTSLHEQRSGLVASRGVNAARFDSYASYATPNARPTTDWPQAIAHSTSSSGPDAGSRGSSGYSNSPSLGEPPVSCAPNLTYTTRYVGTEDHKSPSVNASTAIMYPESPSPSSTSSPHLTQGAQYYTFRDHAGSDDLHPQSFGPGSTMVTLHGGIANICVPGQGNDGLRYRLASRRADSGSGPERSLFPALPALGQDDAYGGANLSEDGSLSQLRSHREPSHPPSPGPTPMSCTVTILKAQAFGAIRRTRGRKRGDEAARLAKEALEARGIALGTTTAGGAKRQRTRYEEED